MRESTEKIVKVSKHSMKAFHCCATCLIGLYVSEKDERLCVCVCVCVHARVCAHTAGEVGRVGWASDEMEGQAENKINAQTVQKA